MNNKIFGRIGEDAAEKYLKEKGYRIVGMNYNTTHGELDIIALRRRVLVFVEVKTRRNLDYGYPGGRIDYRKVGRMRRAATEFCRVDGIGHRVPLYIGNFRYTGRYKSRRFDLIEIIADEEGPKRITHTQNIFKDGEGYYVV